MLLAARSRAKSSHTWPPRPHRNARFTWLNTYDQSIRRTAVNNRKRSLCMQDRLQKPRASRHSLFIPHLEVYLLYKAGLPSKCQRHHDRLSISHPPHQASMTSRAQRESSHPWHEQTRGHRPCRKHLWHISLDEGCSDRYGTYPREDRHPHRSGCP